MVSSPFFRNLVVGFSYNCHISIWGISGILQSKVNKGQPSPKHIFFAQIAVFGLLVFAGSTAIAYIAYYPYNHPKFNSEIWRDPKSSRRSDDLTPRQRMLDDLVKNILPEKNKDEIELLLGKSEDSENKRYVIYMLGPDKSLFSLDGEYIIIWFDDSGNFERYEIMPG